MPRSYLRQALSSRRDSCVYAKRGLKPSRKKFGGKRKSDREDFRRDMGGRAGGVVSLEVPI